MNISDIDVLQDRIGSILYEGVSPDIIIAPQPDVSLRNEVSQLEINNCSMHIITNTYLNRDTTSGIPLDIEQVGSMMASSLEELEIIRELLQEQGYSTSTLNEWWNRFHKNGEDVTFPGISAIKVHDYVSEHQQRAIANIQVINTRSLTEIVRDIYESLKGKIAMNGKPLSNQAIIGGIAYALPEAIPAETMYMIISYLEPPSSSMHVTAKTAPKMRKWYESKVKTIPLSYIDDDNNDLIAELYSKILTPLAQDSDDHIKIDPRIQIFDPQVALERFIIRPTKRLDIVDLVRRSRLSADMPMIAGRISDGYGPSKYISKVYNKVIQDVSWFSNVDIGILRLVIRISKTPHNKYQIIEYHEGENYFHVVRERRRLPISEILSILCTHLNIQTLTVPKVLNTTYHFIINYVASGSISGIDRHVLAYLITNPPPEYTVVRIGALQRSIKDIAFIKEDNDKSNALKVHINIHVLLGAEKMYMSISNIKGRDETTKGTISSVDEELLGFDRLQKYLQVSINKCPSLAYAHICQGLFAHILTMYINHYKEVSRLINDIIFSLGERLQDLSPTILPIKVRDIGIKERASFVDPILFSHLPSGKEIIPSLPTVINHSEVRKYRQLGYMIMKLPTVVVNDFSIKFETNGEIWLRTNNQRDSMYLVKKDSTNGVDHGYIPISTSKEPPNSIRIEVNSDYTLTHVGEMVTWCKNRKNSERLVATNLLENRPGRLADISPSVLNLLKPLVSNGLLFREGLPRNPILVLNRALRIFDRDCDEKVKLSRKGISEINVHDVAKYAYLCTQECWDQSVTQIQDDILRFSIVWMKHFRALEQAFQCNLYFLVTDPVEPYLRKPPHAYFYLHRRGNPQWPTLILYSMNPEDNIFSMITSVGESRSYSFMQVSENNTKIPVSVYMDELMDRINDVHMISKINGQKVDISIGSGTIPVIEGWDPVSQVIDSYGKCRAITFRMGTSMATIDIGYLPIQNDIPLGIIVFPTIDGDVPIINKYSNRPLNVLYPILGSAMSRWIENEKSARILRTVAHLLYSQMDLSIDEFMDRVLVDDEFVMYDLSKLDHSLPNIYGEQSIAWEYFHSVIPTMVGIDEIYVPDDNTRTALENFLGASYKIEWPQSIPGMILYTWDIDANKDETVFLNERSLIQDIVLKRVSFEVTTMQLSPIAYILTSNGVRYLIQMARDLKHAQYIAYMWINHDINPGYESRGRGSVPIDEVPYSFIEKLEEVSYTIFNNKYFVIIPIEE